MNEIWSWRAIAEKAEAKCAELSQLLHDNQVGSNKLGHELKAAEAALAAERKAHAFSVEQLRGIMQKLESLTLDANTYRSPRDCKHGQLARSCEICDLEQQLAASNEEIAELKEQRNADGLHISELRAAIDAARKERK